MADKRIWWAVLPERCVYDLSLKTAMRLAYRFGQLSKETPHGWRPIWSEYGRTDVVRQGLCTVFLAESERPDDTLVMLDIDHEHPISVAQRLVARDVPVVVPLMFRRSQPYQACAFRRGEDGQLHHLATFPPGLHRMDAVGGGAIAIQRQALTALQAAGRQWFFKYEYGGDTAGDEMRSPSEDMYFSKLCEAADVAMYIDTTFETPHIALGLVDRGVYDTYAADHPEEFGELIHA